MAIARNSSANRCDEFWPPGFRFHPTDEELILYYLKRKICRKRLKLDIIAEIDVYKQEPEELPGLSLWKNGDRQWFFFSPRIRKYPNGSRSNRATRHGYWKATGKDRSITCNSRNVGVKKTLVFYRGRAPTGERTDWVMHEYMLDEDELKRCQNVQDYYAIYKVFKKSGPGPKNGEQYGAPFREEDWVDDACPEITSTSKQPEVNNVSVYETCRNAQVNPLLNDGCPKISSTVEKAEGNDVSVNQSCRNAQISPSLNDFDEIINRLVAEPAPETANDFDFEQALSQFFGEESQSTTVNPSFNEVIDAEPSTTYALSSLPNGLEAGFNVSHTETSGLQTWDVPGVTSTANTFEMPPDVANEDFLEMDDLGPEPTQDVSNLMSAIQAGNTFSENSQLRRDVLLDDFDLYYDADAFLQDLDQTVPPDLCPKLQDQTVLPDCGLVNQLGFQTQPCSDSGDFQNELWNDDDNTCLATAMEPNQGSMPLPTTGVVYAGMSTSMATELNQNQGGEDVDGNQPWFSSTLWSFVESIPATPASAAESALVNKAFQRMSSFSRVRINAKSTIAPAGSVVGHGSASASVGGRVKGFFLFSFLAVLFAIICVFIGSNASGFVKSHSRVNL